MRHKGTALLIALVAAGVMVDSALAVTNPIIDWSPTESFAYEPNFVMPHQSIAGNELTIIGKIDTFNDPLNGNDPNAAEYTFVFDQLISQGGVFLDQGNFDQWNTSYTGGRFRIFKDLTPDRDYGINPPNATAPTPTFDGDELILSGEFFNFKTVSNAWTPDINNGGNYNADLKFTGGTQLGLLQICPDQNGYHGQLIGVWQRGVSATPTGYIRSCDGKMDLYDCPVPTEPSTWSRIKSIME